MKKLLILAGILILAYMAVQYSRSDYLAFQAKRESWYQQCSAYVGSTATRTDPVMTDACQRELEELLAYAKRKGWTD